VNAIETDRPVLVSREQSSGFSGILIIRHRRRQPASGQPIFNDWMGPMSMIRALRERNGISAEMLARRMGVTLDIVEGWERAESSPNERQVGSLARILGTSKSAITDPRMISKDATIEPESAVD